VVPSGALSGQMEREREGLFWRVSAAPAGYLFAESANLLGRKVLDEESEQKSAKADTNGQSKREWERERGRKMVK